VQSREGELGFSPLIVSGIGSVPSSTLLVQRLCGRFC
jgi:hypothetical protein